MRIAEIFMDKLGIQVPKPKDQVCTLIETLLYSIVTRADIAHTLKLLSKDFDTSQLNDRVDVLINVLSHYPLVKLSSNATATSVFLKLLPDYEVHNASGEKVSTFVYEPKEFITALGYSNTVKWSTFKSAFYKSIIAINNVLDDTIIVAKADAKTKNYKVSFISNVRDVHELRGELINLGVTALTDLDKYLHMFSKSKGHI